jgi:V/A-type H+-transporting ATPase subunit K
MKRKAFLLIFVLLALLGTTVSLPAQDQTNQASTQDVKKRDISVGLIAVAAAVAVGLCAIGTGLAQSRIGAAGAGTIAEKPDMAGTIILLVAIPETMVILGFVVAIVMLFIL